MEPNTAGGLQGRFVEAITEAANQADNVDTAIGSKDNLDDRISLDMVLFGFLGVDGLGLEGDLGWGCGRDGGGS